MIALTQSSEGDPATEVLELLLYCECVDWIWLHFPFPGLDTGIKPHIWQEQVQFSKHFQAYCPGSPPGGALSGNLASRTFAADLDADLRPERLLRCAKWIRLLGKNHSAPSPTLSLNKIKNLKKRHIFLI